MEYLADLISRVFGHYKSSVTGLAVVLIAYLDDHGITLSEPNKAALTAKLVAIATGLWMLFWKDEKGGDPNENV